MRGTTFVPHGIGPLPLVSRVSLTEPNGCDCLDNLEATVARRLMKSTVISGLRIREKTLPPGGQRTDDGGRPVYSACPRFGCHLRLLGVSTPRGTAEKAYTRLRFGSCGSVMGHALCRKGRNSGMCMGCPSPEKVFGQGNFERNLV